MNTVVNLQCNEQFYNTSEKNTGTVLKNIILHNIFYCLEINKFSVLEFITHLFRNLVFSTFPNTYAGVCILLSVVVLKHLQYLQGTIVSC